MLHVRNNYSSTVQGSVAVVGRGAGGSQDRSGAKWHDCNDGSELLDLHVASESGWCE